MYALPDSKSLLRKINKKISKAESLQDDARTCIKRKQFDKAQSLLEEALRLNEFDGFNYLYLGNVFYWRKQYDDALANFLIAEKHLENKAVSYWCAGDAYNKLGNQELAELHYEKAVKAAPDCTIAKRKLQKFRAPKG